MSSAVFLASHTFTGQASSKRLTSIVHILLPETDNCPPWISGENDRRKYFMINLHERMLPTLAGVEPVTSWSPVGRRIQLSLRGWQSFQKISNRNHFSKLKKDHNSHNNWWILPLIELDLYFMIMYLCIKYDSNTLIFSKKISNGNCFSKLKKGHNSYNNWWILP